MAGKPAQPRVDLHITFDNVQQETLEEIQASLAEARAELLLLRSEAMATHEQIMVELGRINTATSNVAGDLRDVIRRLGELLSPDQAQEIFDTLSGAASTLEGVAAEYTDNDPVPEPEPVPEPPVEP